MRPWRRVSATGTRARVDPVMFFALEPSRGNIVARLRRSGAKKAVLLMAYTDEVGVQRERWSVDPFAAVRKNGYVYGRQPGCLADSDAAVEGTECAAPSRRDAFMKSTSVAAAQGHGISNRHHWAAATHRDLGPRPVASEFWTYYAARPLQRRAKIRSSPVPQRSRACGSGTSERTLR